MVAIVAVVIAVVSGAVVLRRSGRGSTAGALGSTPVTVLAPTTVAYNARPGPGGVRLLTEPVDLLTLAVPSSWQTPAPDPLKLPALIAGLAAQAPPLTRLLQAVAQQSQLAGVRLFAFQPMAPQAFVSVVSFSSPGIVTPTPAVVDALAAQARKKSPNLGVSAVQLPVGRVLKLDSVVTTQKQPVAVEVLVIYAGGRTMEIEMVAETTSAQVPPVFDQIAHSLHLG
jgi:hypothetical protein